MPYMVIVLLEMVFPFLFLTSVIFGLSLLGEIEGSNAAATQVLQNVVDKAL